MSFLCYRLRLGHYFNTSFYLRLYGKIDTYTFILANVVMIHVIKVIDAVNTTTAGAENV